MFFLVTEDLSYFEIFKDYFNDKLIFLDTPRSKSSMFGTIIFILYRIIILIDALMLSSTNVLLDN